jgi:hypothetical protein
LHRSLESTDALSSPGGKYEDSLKAGDGRIKLNVNGHLICERLMRLILKIAIAGMLLFPLFACNKSSDTAAPGAASYTSAAPAPPTHTHTPTPSPPPPVGGNPTALLAESPTWAVDAMIARMQSANIAFNPPTEMDLDNAQEMKLVMDLHRSAQELVTSIATEGKVETNQVKVSDTMTAHLTGDDFNITINTPETQLTSAHEPTTWSWRLKPKTSGTHQLFLTLDTVFTIGGKEAPRAIRAFSETINVNVS